MDHAILMQTNGNTLDLLSDLIRRAKSAGADAADAILAEGSALSHARRLGKTEKLERAEGMEIGLRVLIGRRQAIVSSNDRSREALDSLVERALAMARVVPEDPFCGIAEPDAVARTWPELDIFDPNEATAETLIARTAAAEEAALAVAGVTNSEGAESSASRSVVTLVASNGFSGSYRSSGHSVSVAVVAGEGLGMERDYDWSSSIHGADLMDPAEVGRRAGERAVGRLGPRKPTTAQVPVVFDSRIAGGLVRHLLGAINGSAIARGTSFLKDKLGQQVLSHGLTIVEDPHRRRGLRSKPFDAEGLPNRRMNLVEDGVLTTWLLDLRSARQLGLKPTGHAARGSSGPPSPSSTNVWLEAGPVTRNELLSDITEGFLVTELMGMGVNGVTGDYSRGAAGFWIKDGAVAYPVSELTIAGNLKEMFLHMTPANDLEFRTGTDAPTVRIDGMTVAGS